MNIDELSKLAIAEIEKEFEDKKPKEESLSTEEELINKIKTIQENKENKEIQIINDNSESKVSNLERKYLENVKERMLVLFEALNTKQNEEDLKKRLELTIGFIEFLLASIEERLK